MECLYCPEIRRKAVAVGGDVEQRHGIILAKNYIAKKYAIKTGETLWKAKQKCPELVIVPPNFERYLEFSQLARNIYIDYSPCVESFGLDECWLDLTGTGKSGKTAADEIRERIKFELGVTASIGVSFNKIFAKLGSDMKKPDATTVIPREEFRNIVWPLPVEDLLFVGPATKKKFYRRMIYTIGDLANSDVREMERMLGKNGRTLWAFANGLDNSPVAENGDVPPIESIGNSTTTPRDLISDKDVKITIMVLAESIASRMRNAHVKCTTVQISVRDNELRHYERQKKLGMPVATASYIAKTAFELYKQHHKNGKPIRSLGVRACGLIPEKSFYQLSFFEKDMEQEENIERTIDDIRRRFGHFSLQRGIMLTDKQLSHLNPKADHMIHPERYYK